MTEPEDESKGFKVTDRRKFAADGEPREEPEAASPGETSQEEEPRSDARKPASDSAAKPESNSERAEVGPAPEVSFLDLVNMLSTNALMQLGDMQDPVSGKSVENLQGAQVMIAFLTLLKDKTKGNLEKEEDKILDEILYNLRMRFLAKSNVIKH